MFFFFNQVPETRAMSLCNLQIPKKTWRNDSESSWQRFSNLEQGFKVMTVYPVRLLAKVQLTSCIFLITFSTR